MKPNVFFTPMNRPVHLNSNQVISLRGKAVHINCLSGSLFVSWPKGQERTMTAGDHISVSARGKICILAFSPSLVAIRKDGFGY